MLYDFELKRGLNGGGKIKKKLSIIIVLALFLPLVSVVSVGANPIWTTFGMYPWVNFKVTPSGLHIANDPLFYSSDIASIAPFDPSATSFLKGWITYVCSSEKPQNQPTGLEYSIEVKDIAQGTYTVKAYPVSGSSDLGIVASYTLGTIAVGSNGQGKISGFYDLAGPASYEWEITVELNGTPILETHYADPVAFFAIS